MHIKSTCLCNFIHYSETFLINIFKKLIEMEKELFPALKPWLKFCSYWPVNADTFPLRKKIHFVLYLIMFYIPSVLFVANAKDYGSFFIGITENLAMILVIIQTFLLGIEEKNLRILVVGLEDAWRKCELS